MKTVKVNGQICEVEPCDGGYDTENEYRWVVIAPRGWRWSGYCSRTISVWSLSRKPQTGPQGRNLGDVSLEEGDPS